MEIGFALFGLYVLSRYLRGQMSRSWNADAEPLPPPEESGVPVYRNDYEARCRILQEENERLQMERVLHEADIRSLRGDRISERMTLILFGASAAVFVQLILAVVINPELFVPEEDATATFTAASRHETRTGDACVITDAARDAMMIAPMTIRPSWLSPPTFPLPAGISALMNDEDVTYLNADRWDLITKWRLAEGLARAGVRPAPELLWRP